MITEIFQFLFKLPDHDTSIRPPPSVKPVPKPQFSQNTPKSITATPPAGLILPNQSGKLSDLKRVFQRVACFPCEYLIDVHKLLFMKDCDQKVIRQNIFEFKGFSFGPESQEFQQRKMYLEYLTFHSLRKISSVLTTRSVDLRNSTKHELATHLTQVLTEYCNLNIDEVKDSSSEIPTPSNVSSVSSSTPVETIVVTPLIDPAITGQISETPDSSVSASTNHSLNIAIVDARSVSSANDVNKAGVKRKIPPIDSPPAKSQKIDSDSQLTDINLPEVEQYQKLLKMKLNDSGASKPEVILPESLLDETVESSIEKKLLSKVIPTKNVSDQAAFQSKIREAAGDDDEDLDKPLSLLVGHPIDSVLKKHIVDIVEQSNLQSITINSVIQKVYSMYPKFDLSYRKEFIKSTLRSILYKLGQDKNLDSHSDKRNTDSPDCSVSTTENCDNESIDSPNAVECS